MGEKELFVEWVCSAGCVRIKKGKARGLCAKAEVK